MREKLRFVRSHIDIDRAVTFTALTRQTQIERCFDMLVEPSLRQGVATEHFKQEAGAPARRVHLFMRD